ncbi:MAG TPA: lysozyme inhibitor LprI family protein [Pyrinomonadaceae bacterium]|nr:lysozyme inhibitor LprI family protein [Pyrinomonadaceae bacterium]
MSRYFGLHHLASARLLLVCACLGFAIVSSFGSVDASSRAKGQTQQEINDQACSDYKQADREMNQAYQTILQDYRKDRGFVAALRKAQLAWIRYRDAHLNSIFPGDRSQYGSINTMCRCNDLAELTKERTQVLNRWVAGIAEGDVCAGSVKVK